MSFMQYFRFFQKWLWLITLAAFLSGAVGFITRTSSPLIYSAKSVVLIGNFLNSPNPDYSSINIGFTLTQTYAELVKTNRVLQGTIDTLNLPFTTGQLAGLVTVELRPGTSILDLTIQYTDPVLAADIANEVANQLVENSPSNLTPEQENQIALANEQITALNQQLTSTRNQLALIDEQLGTETNTETVNQMTARRDVLVAQANEASSTIAQFARTIADIQLRSNVINIQERAEIPTSPSSGGRGSSSVIITNAMIGAALAVAAGMLIEYLDDKVRTRELATQTLALPVLGAIPKFGKRVASYPERLLINQPPMSPIAESYRSLRTNLLFTTEDNNKSVFIVTSAGPVEGKSTTTANLAVSLAQAGLRVLLIDADLRRPRLHEIFELDNNVGLTTLLFADPSKLNRVMADTRLEDEEKNIVDLRRSLQDTKIPNLRVIASGFLPSNSTEILGSALMQRWISAFQASSNIDVILIDTPPCLLISDSSVLAATIQSKVLLVIDATKTRRIAAIKAKEQFEQVGVHIKGVILNRINPRDEDYGYGYGYGYYYQKPDTKQVTHPNGAK
jgi:polysaccharide biosynthesis transport protein